MRYSPVARATSVEYVAASGATVYMGTEAPAGTPALAFVAPDTATAGVTFQATIAASGAASGPWSLNVPSGWTVSPSSGSSVAPGSPVTINVTATEGTQSLTLTCSGATITGNPQSIVVSAAGGGLTVGAQVYTLAATNLSGSGSRPFSATVLPLRGAVPSGERLTDSTGAFDSTVLSTHDDGSAAVVVVSGTASGTGTLNLHRATGSTTALTAAAIGALVTSVEVAFGAPYGTASLTDFSTPERTWWANSKTICARYRVAAPTPGSTALEAVIDVHAWAGRALVEVAVENSKFDAAASTSSTKPAAATYASAVVSINGSTVATVAASGAAEGSHGAFRAWYASGWVGAGNPGLRVTQAVSDLQEHPLLWRMDAANSADLSTYAADAYAPWGTGRHRATNMGGTGDHASIGPLPKWEAQALQSGDYRAWNAVEVSTLSMLSYNINHRDSVTGRVPDSSLMAQKCQGSFWANWPKNTAEPAFEVAHQPASGLMAFIARPSPVFIEIAQKIGVWTGTVDSTRDLFNNFDEAAVGITDSTGIVGNQQIRAKAWGPRNIAHAAYLSPDDHEWKAGGLVWLDRNVRYLESYAANSRNVLLPLWEGEPDAPVDVDTGQTGTQVSLWMYHFCVTEWHKIAESRLLAGISTARQTAVDTVADGLALPVVKWVTEQTNGGWRFLPYRTRLGSAGTPFTAYTTWTAQRAADLSGAPSTVSGQFSGASVGSESTWAAVEALGFETTAQSSSLYTANFWAALMAACERSVAGATTAVETVLNGITNLTTWRTTFGTDPRWGAYARNAPVGWESSINVLQWTEVADSTPFGTWAAANTLPGSGYLSTGAPFTALVDAFSEWTMDDSTGMLYLTGGGHFDSSVNAVYSFNPSSLQYAIPVPPTPPSKYPPAWVSLGQANANITYPSGLVLEYFGSAADLTAPADAAYINPERQRRATHSYASNAITGGRMLCHFNLFGAANLTTGKWESVVPVNPYGAQMTALGFGNSTDAFGPLTCALTDPATGKQWVAINGGDGGDNLRPGIYKIDPDTQVIEAKHGSSTYYGNMVQDSTYVYLFWCYDAGGGAGTHYNLVTRVNKSTGVKDFPGITGTLCPAPSGSMETAPICTDGTYAYLWHYATNKHLLYRVHLTTFVGDTVTLTTSAIPNPTIRYRLHYRAAHNLIMVLPTGTSKWWATKLS